MQYHVIEVKTEQVFLNLYMGFIQGGNKYGEKKKEFGAPGAVARLERKIKLALHAISREPTEVEKKEGQAPPRKLIAEPSEVVLETQLFKMLETYVNAVEWLTSGCEEVAELFDALDGAKKEDRG